MYLRNTSRWLLASALLAGGLPLPSALAQGIWWHAPAAITGDADVVTNGTSVYAYDYANSAQTVNGVSFVGANSANAGGNVGTTLVSYNTTAFTSTASPFAGLSTAYKGILVGAAYATSTSAYTVTLSNLVSGHAYAVQFWVNDPRGAENARTVTLSSLGGNSVVLGFSTGPGTTAGYAGQYCVGLFTNFGAPQTFTLQSLATTVPQMNALQVQDLGAVVALNAGYWNGLGGAMLDYTSLNFCTNAYTAPLGTAASLGTLGALALPAFFSDVYFNSASPTPVTSASLTVAAGGITNSAIDFVNTNVSYTLNSSDASGITGATTVGLFGSGMVTFAGPNTYSGGTVIAGGTLQVGAGGASGSLGSGPVANYASLVFDRSDSPTFSNPISGNGTVAQIGSGTLFLSNAIVGGPLTTLSQSGSGALVLAGTNTYGGTLLLSSGTVTVSGSGPGGSPYSSLWVGGATGNATMNFASSGTWTIATSSGSFLVGGSGSISDTGAGAFNQSAGTINFASSGVYLTTGDGSPTAYGSYVQSGGTLTIGNSSGIRAGFGGLGSWVQTGGTLNCSRYFSIGGNNASGNAVATFLGGTAIISSSYRILIGDAAGSTAVMNLGTEAGGAAFISHLSGTGIDLSDKGGGANGTLNLNSGSILLGGPIFRNNTGGTATVNLNGAALQADSSIAMMNTTLSTVNVYNGGITLDSQTYSPTVSASLLATTGNGIYPVGGVLSIASGGGSGYIGAPLVTVSGGSGSGAMAIANVTGGVVTGVTMTCPGVNYLAGDSLSFAFAGGGAATPASTFAYTLKAADVTPNLKGGLTKLGSGTLTLSGANTYTGSTIVGSGTLNVTVDGGLGQGNVVVANGAALTLSGGLTNGYLSPTANLTLNVTATNNLNYTGNMMINGLSTNGGLVYLAPGVYGAVGSAAPNVLPQLKGTGLITVTATPVVAAVVLNATSSPNPSTAGQPVTLTATVTGSLGTPSGTVTFLSGGVSLGSATLNGSGVATFVATNFSTAGTDLITANYSGNGTYSSASTLFPLSQVVNPRLDLWSGAKSSAWDITNTSNWFFQGVAATYHDTDAVQFDDTATGSTALSLGLAVNPNSVIFTNNLKNYSLSGTGAIAGAASLTMLGQGNVNLSNTNTYTGNTAVSNGALTFSGAGSYTGAGVLNVGDGFGLATLYMSSTGSVTFSGTPSVGGITGDSSDTGSGAIYQSAGTINFGANSSDIYLELGTGGSNAYGYYELDGGTLNIINASGVRDGYGGLGSWVQNGGVLNCTRYFAVGGSTATGNGVATFNGGTATISSSYRILIGDSAGATAVLNLGTEAGGTAFISHLSATGVDLSDKGGGSICTLNLNRGSMLLGGPIFRNNSGGTTTVNLNGASLQANAGIVLIDSSLNTVNVYNGGVTLDSQSYSATVPASLQGLTGNGIYPSGGVLSILSHGGSSYLGAPLVTVSGGSGSGAMAIANLTGGVVTGVTLTCPGTDYVVGDVVSFAFAGGGTASPASTFNYTLKAADVAPNTSGGLTKLGTGTLMLSGYNTYTGNTLVSNGTLEVDGLVNSAVLVTGGMLAGYGSVTGAVTVQTNGTLGAGTAAGVGQLTLSSSLSLAGTASLRIDKTGGALQSDEVQGMTGVTYGGALVVADVTSDGTLLALGDKFTLFGSTGYSGSFTSFHLPALPNGLAWNVANLAVDGSIQVVAVSTTPPTITHVLSGANLNLGWPSDHTGWRLLVQTNNLAAGVSTNLSDWGTVAGSSATNQVSIPINTTKPAEFYRLVYP